MRTSPVEVDASERVELAEEPRSELDDTGGVKLLVVCVLISVSVPELAVDVVTGARVLDDVDCGASPELLVAVLGGLKVLTKLGLLLEPADTEVTVVDVVPDCRVVDPEEADCDADPVLPPVVIDTGILEVLLVPEAKLDVPDIPEVLLLDEETPVKLVELLRNAVEDDNREELPDVVNAPVEPAEDGDKEVEEVIEDVNEDEDEAGDEDNDPVEETPPKLVELLRNDAEDDNKEELPDVVSAPVELANDGDEEVEGDVEDVNEDEDEAGDEDKDEDADENVEDNVDKIEEASEEDSDEDDKESDNKDDDDEDNGKEDDDKVRRDEDDDDDDDEMRRDEDDDDEVRRDEVVVVDAAHAAGGSCNPYTV